VTQAYIEGQQAAPVGWQQQMQQQMQQLQQQVQNGQQQLQQQMQQLQNGQQQTQNGLQQMRAEMRVFACNSTASNAQSPIMPLSNDQGNFPAHFPPTRGDLLNCMHGEFNQLMAFYGLPHLGTSHADLIAKKSALCAHLGIRE
jgi:uncharacterized phage infection (PIP) family protein YhgE